MYLMTWRALFISSCVSARKHAFGANVFEYPPPKTFLLLCREAGGCLLENKHSTDV